MVICFQDSFGYKFLPAAFILKKQNEGRFFWEQKIEGFENDRVYLYFKKQKSLIFLVKQLLIFSLVNMKPAYQIHL